MSTAKATARRGAARISGFGTSIFSEMSALAVQYDAVNLGQGFPDFAAPEFVKAAAQRAIAADQNQYAPSAGSLRLRRALAEGWRRRHPRAWQPDPASEITVGCGVTELLLDVFLGLLDPGDEVLLFEPAYDAYAPGIAMAAARAVGVPLRGADWTIDFDEVAARTGPKTRMVVVNTPHNPTGKVWSEDELSQLARLCVERDWLAVTDEVYSELVFDGERHRALATFPGMAERTITLDSMGKTFGVTGWKVGWAIASAPLTAAVRQVHQFATFTNSVPFQEALADVLESEALAPYLSELRATYGARRQRLRAVLEEAGLRPLRAAGSYFLLADFLSSPAEVWGRFATDVEFCRHLVKEIGVAAIPISVFFSDPARAPQLARFCFAKKDETLNAAAARLITRKKITP